MKKLLLLAASLTLSLTSQAADTYKIDPTHSSIGYSLRHMISKFSSSFTDVTGTIEYDADKVEASKVEATVNVAALNTANEKRDNHIKSADFFDTANYPTATFKSTSWTKTGEGTFDVVGDLTLKDVTKPVTLKVTLLGTGPGMQPGTVTSGWEATTTIKKSDFNMAGPAMLGKALGDEVAITINLEANGKK